jgi:hypothetical protein
LRVQAINEMLRSEGFPAPLPRSTSSKDTAFTANLVYLILQSRAQREERVAEQEETIKRCHFDLQVSRQHGARLQGDLHRREEECKALTLKLSNSVEKAKKERERLGGERDKAAAECVSMRHRDAQREHAMRKLEMERDKLKVQYNSPPDTRRELEILSREPWTWMSSRWGRVGSRVLFGTSLRSSTPRSAREHDDLGM